ncbi:hypothetical protein [Oryza sativa Japonica Group]|uniref:Uncharacterized protein n=1 Tax=Oryza sativa subsp. japonica TaxID=39947 RepID=Q5VMQ4_ORYSJ|nr:hypothetical protein [Oryza sativa Japonica Group]BAD69271.1 hypothetical protein [Oryza sativa Japonica Group]
MALNREVAGAGGLGRVFRGHLCEEDDDANSPPEVEDEQYEGGKVDFLCELPLLERIDGGT